MCGRNLTWPGRVTVQFLYLLASWCLVSELRFKLCTSWIWSRNAKILTWPFCHTKNGHKLIYDDNYFCTPGIVKWISEYYRGVNSDRGERGLDLCRRLISDKPVDKSVAWPANISQLTPFAFNANRADTQRNIALRQSWLMRFSTLISVSITIE
jgi:hypothetical protein